MNRNLVFMLFAVMCLSLFVACGSTSDDSQEATSNQVDINADDTESSNQEQDTEGDEPSNVVLPADFPADFPFPDNISITEVRDNSEGDKKDYTIRFTFDPDMDLDAVFKMYDEYANKINYESLIEGEEYFAEDIFQYAAMKESSLSNKFIVTMKPTDGTYGSIDLQIEK